MLGVGPRPQWYVGVNGPYLKQFLRRCGTLLMKPGAVAALPKTNVFAVWTAGRLALGGTSTGSERPTSAGRGVSRQLDAEQTGAEPTARRSRKSLRRADSPLSPVQQI
jgi:hypothetical protein